MPNESERRDWPRARRVGGAGGVGGKGIEVIDDLRAYTIFQASVLGSVAITLPSYVFSV